MIFHNINTINIGQFSEIMTAGNLASILRVNIWVPKRVLQNRVNKLIAQYNNVSSDKEVVKEIIKNKHKLKLLTQINIQYPIMLAMLNLVSKFDTKEAKKLLVDTYSHIYNKKPETVEDYEKIYKDLNLKIRRYAQNYSEDEEKEGIDFEQLLLNIESILAPLSIRDKKLYLLPKYTNLALKKIK